MRRRSRKGVDGKIGSPYIRITDGDGALCSFRGFGPGCLPIWSLQDIAIAAGSWGFGFGDCGLRLGHCLRVEGFAALGGDLSGLFDN